MQKMAYTINREPAETQARFKLLMTTFARQDPLYKTGMELVHEIVAKEPGIRQTKLYPHLQPMSTEDARYVLYFAHELGDICRVKKGNSYLVYLPPDAPLIL